MLWILYFKQSFINAQNFILYTNLMKFLSAQSVKFTLHILTNKN